MTESLSGKKVLIIGSTDGLGKLIARHLVQKDAVVLLHGRSEEKGKSVLIELKKLTHSEKINYYNGDYSSLDDVKLLSDRILMEQKSIDILINNVGIGRGLPSENKRELSKEGIELRFAVNYVAHVLLTEKLLPLLKPETSRIINVASVGQETVNFDNLMLDKNYDGFLAYRQSKTALIMYTFDLADRLKGLGIKVNAIHPASLMNTKMVLKEWDYTLTTVEEGAEAVESLLFTETTGAYFDGKLPATAIPQAYDVKARAMLHNITWELLENYL